MYTNTEFNSWVDKNVNTLDYVIMEPPCFSRTPQPLWAHVSLIDIFQSFRVNYLFMWVEATTLPTLFTGYLESDYEFRTLFPWIKVTKTDSLFCSLTTSAKNSVEYLVVFQKPGAPKLKFNDGTVIVDEQDTIRHKPRKWEEYLHKQLSYSGLEGIYIYSTGTYENLKSTDVDSTPTVHKTELF